MPRVLRGARLSNMGGLLCNFAPSPHWMPASWVGFEHLQCLSPRLELPATHSPEVNGSLIPHGVRVTVNGATEDVALGGPGFLYYVDDELRVERIYPRGGPVDGGTLVTVTGSGFAELDHGSGLACQFGDEPLAPATLSSSSRLTCHSPPHAGATVVVRITNNGDREQTSRELVGFTYYRVD